LNSSLASQFQGFVISIGVGLLLGVYYDIFRIFRTVFRSESRAVFFQDLFYMLSAAFVTFLLALGVNYGDVRFYILAGEIIGWCLYYLTVGMITIRLFKFISYILYRFLINPIKKIILQMYHWFCNILNIIVKKVKIVASNRKKRLKPHRKIVYNHFIIKRKGNGKV
jgi:spore cortex biosynthesis protein YabQ